MKISEVGSSLFLIALGGFMAWQSQRLSLGSPRAPGMGFFPFYLGLLLIIIAIIIFFQGMKQIPSERETELRWGRVVLAMVAIFVYAFVLAPLGYLLSTFCLMLLLLTLMAKKAWWFAPALACLTSLVSYVLFKVWLGLLLPRGILGF